MKIFFLISTCLLSTAGAEDFDEYLSDIPDFPKEFYNYEDYMTSHTNASDVNYEELSGYMKKWMELWGSMKELKLAGFGFRRENFNMYVASMSRSELEKVEDLDLSYNLLVFLYFYICYIYTGPTTC